MLVVTDSRAHTDHLPITLITSIKMVISPVVSTSVSVSVNEGVGV